MAPAARERKNYVSGAINEYSALKGTKRGLQSTSKISSASISKHQALGFTNSDFKTPRKATQMSVGPKEYEYITIVSGVDTGLCGKYWSDMENLPPRRRCTLNDPKTEVVHGPANIVCKFCGPHQKSNGRGKQKLNDKKDLNVFENGKSNVNKDEAQCSRSSTLTVGPITIVGENAAQKCLEIIQTGEQGEKDHEISSNASIIIEQNGGTQASRNVSCEEDTNSKRKEVAQCFASFDDHNWTSIKQSKGEPVQYAQVLNPPCHIVSKLKLMGNQSVRARNSRNTMIFHLLNGQISIIIADRHYNGRKGDSFYVSPKQIYQMINTVDEEALFTIVQFTNEGTQASRNVSCAEDTNCKRKEVSKCFASFGDHSWTSLKQSKGEPVQYAKALSLPCHIVSNLKLKGFQSMKTRNSRNTMIFHVLNGQISIMIADTEYNAQRGDSFYVLPKQIYQMINTVDEEAVFSLVQFRCTEEMKTV